MSVVCGQRREIFPVEERLWIRFVGLIVQRLRGFCFAAIGWSVLQADSYYATPFERFSASAKADVGRAASHGRKDDCAQSKLSRQCSTV